MFFVFVHILLESGLKFVDRGDWWYIIVIKRKKVGRSGEFR